MMRIELARLKARTAPERWRQQYEAKDGTWGKVYSGDSKAIYDQLLQCGDDPAKVAAAVGNKGWSYVECAACGEYHLAGVVIGTDYSDSNVTLCQTCLRAASAAINAVCESL